MKIIEDKRIQAVVDFIGAVTLNLWLWVAPDITLAIFKSIKAVAILQIFGITVLILFGHELIRLRWKHPNAAENDTTDNTNKEVES